MTHDEDTPRHRHRPGPGRSKVYRSKARRRRRIVLLTVLSLVGLVVAGGSWAYYQLDSNTTTFDSAGVSKNRPPANVAGQNVLLIGSDARSAGNSKLGGGNEDVGHSDTAILLHVYGDQKHAVGVSIPRDTLVDLPPCLLPNGKWSAEQHNAMFNSAFSTGQSLKGNPACTQNAVEKLTGLRVDHTIVVDFRGFAAMTDAVGGVQVCVPKDIYQQDLNPGRTTRGSLLFAKGVQTVSGQKALDYVRLRHGIGDGSDIGRMKRQQAFLSALIKKVKGQGLDPTTLLPLANAATKALTVDPGLGSAAKLMGFAMGLKNIDLPNIKFVTLPWRFVGARVAVMVPEAEKLWADIKADRTIDGKNASGKQGPSPAPSAAAQVVGTGISVGVYNGTSTAHLAAHAAAALKKDGFTITTTATAAGTGHATTVIKYGSGQHNSATALAKLFPGAGLVPSTIPGLKLILGQDYAATAHATISPTPPPTTAGTPAPLNQTARSASDNPCTKLTYG